jgi:hypothetical protein
VTFLPVDYRERGRVVGVKGPKYKVGRVCCNPNCSRDTQDAHHMWRRSEIVKDFDWVNFDGWIVACKVGVCIHCHIALTEGKMSIRLDEEARLFDWCIVTGSKTTGDVKHNPVGRIDPQPLTPELHATLAPDQGTGSEDCPFCGQSKRRRPRLGTAVGRRRKTWLVQVPADDLEHGAEVLDSLVENLSPFVPNADGSTVGRYYVLVPVLAYAQMNVKNFVSTMEGVGG